jgi:hypothetical protein
VYCVTDVNLQIVRNRKFAKIFQPRSRNTGLDNFFKNLSFVISNRVVLIKLYFPSPSSSIISKEETQTQEGRRETRYYRIQEKQDLERFFCLVTTPVREMFSAPRSILRTWSSVQHECLSIRDQFHDSQTHCNFQLLVFSVPFTRTGPLSMSPHSLFVLGLNQGKKKRFR